MNPPTQADRDDDVLREEIRTLVNSKAWKTLRVWLLNRRAMLFAEEPSDQFALWRNRGALHEVNLLLRAPEAALFEMARTHIAGEPLPEEMAPPWVAFASESHDKADQY